MAASCQELVPREQRVPSAPVVTGSLKATLDKTSPRGSRAQQEQRSRGRAALDSEPLPIWSAREVSRAAGWQWSAREVSRAAEWLSFLVPALLAAWVGANTGQWRSDEPLARAFALAPALGNGAVRTLLARALCALPLGSLEWRAALVQALALGVLGWLIHGWIGAILEERSPSGGHAPVALLASLAATCSPTMLRETSDAGGVALASALAFGVALTLSRSEASWSRRLLSGALLGALCLEHLPLGIFLLLCAVLTTALAQGRSRREWLPPMLLGALLSLGVVGLPLLRASSPSVLVQSVRALGALALEVHPSMRALSGWLDQLGVVTLLLAVLGLASLARHRGLRPSLGLLVALILPFLWEGTPLPGTLDALRPVELLTAASLACAAAVGLIVAARFLWATRPAYAISAVSLLVAAQLANVISGAHDALCDVDVSRWSGAARWSTESLLRLPPRAILWPKDPVALWHLLATQLVDQARPDVLPVVEGRLGSIPLELALLHEEPALVEALRDFSVHGQVSELTLSRLADRRPVFCDMHREWPTSMQAHLLPMHLWWGFAPEPLAASDRRSPLDEPWAEALFQKTLHQAPVDEDTLAALGRLAEQRAELETRLGERDGALLELSHLASWVGVIGPMASESTPKSRHRSHRYLQCPT